MASSEWPDADNHVEIGGQVQDSDEEWHPCGCGAMYRSEKAALRCCDGHFGGDAE